MKKDTKDRQAKPMGHNPQPATNDKPTKPNGSGKNKGYKENRDHTTGAEQGDPRKERPGTQNV